MLYHDLVFTFMLINFYVKNKIISSKRFKSTRFYGKFEKR